MDLKATPPLRLYAHNGLKQTDYQQWLGFGTYTTPESMPYTSSKHTIANLTRNLLFDGRHFDRRASQIDIGNALTEMDQNITVGIPQADGSVRAEAVKDASHVANAVLHAASLPLDANLQFMTVIASKMPFFGRD